MTISGTPPPNDWIVYEPPSEAHGESIEEPVEEPVKEWEDVPEFEPLQEMLANVYDDAEQGETASVDADWRVSVSVKLVPPLPSDMSSQAYATYDTFEGISLTAQLNSCAILTAESLSQLSSPTAWLNDDCINICAHLLRSLFPARQNNNYTLLSTYVMADHHNPLEDDHCTWQNTYKTQYWAKVKWIVPIHHLKAHHWVLCIVDHVSQHIDFFDSFGECKEWMKDIEVSFSGFLEF